MGKAIDAIEREHLKRPHPEIKENKDEDLVPMGTASLADIAKAYRRRRMRK